jgi:hypothetical protein
LNNLFFLGGVFQFGQGAKRYTIQGKPYGLISPPQQVTNLVISRSN